MILIKKLLYPTLILSLLFGYTSANANEVDNIKHGGTFTYLEQQKHANLYPPIGFYPNNGIINQIADRLTYQNPQTLEIEPWIASSWSVNEDKTQYTFTIRDGVTFSDGEKLDAAAVAKIFDTYGLGNKNLKLPISEVINNYQKSEVIDDHKVKFYFTQPAPGFLQATSTIASGLVSPKTLSLSLDELGNATKIIGSGPFVVEKETLGKEITFKAREDYNWAPVKLVHQGRAYIDQLKFVIIPEDSVRVGALTSEQADFIRRLEPYTELQVKRLGYPIYSASTGGINTMINIRPENPIVSEILVRKALLAATDTEQIIKTLYSDSYPQATSVLTKQASGYINLSSLLSYNPTQANQLLDQAGWQKQNDGYRYKDGKKLELTIYEALTQSRNKEMLQLIAQQWKAVGVSLKVLSADAGTRTLAELDPNKTPLAMGMIGRADPDVLKGHFHPKNRDLLRQVGGASQSVKTFSDPTLNKLLESISTEHDVAKRLELTQQVQRYVLEQAYVIPIYQEPQVYAGASYAKGVVFEPSARPTFYSVWLDK